MELKQIVFLGLDDHLHVSFALPHRRDFAEYISHAISSTSTVAWYLRFLTSWTVIDIGYYLFWNIYSFCRSRRSSPSRSKLQIDGPFDDFIGHNQSWSDAVFSQFLLGSCNYVSNLNRQLQSWVRSRWRYWRSKMLHHNIFKSIIAIIIKSLNTCWSSSLHDA